MNLRITASGLALLAALTLSGCGGTTEAASTPASSKPAPVESIDAEAAKDDCTVMTALLAGTMPDTGLSTEEMVAALASKGTGEVKNTAKFILGQVDNNTASTEEKDEVIQKFKDFCIPYVD